MLYVKIKNQFTSTVVKEILNLVPESVYAGYETDDCVEFDDDAGYYLYPSIYFKGFFDINKNPISIIEDMYSEYDNVGELGSLRARSEDIASYLGRQEDYFYDDQIKGFLNKELKELIRDVSNVRYVIPTYPHASIYTLPYSIKYLDSKFSFLPMILWENLEKYNTGINEKGKPETAVKKGDL